MNLIAVVAQPLQSPLGVVTGLFLCVLGLATQPLLIKGKNFFEHNLLLLCCLGTLEHLSAFDDIVYEHLVEDSHLLGFLEIFLRLALQRISKLWALTLNNLSFSMIPCSSTIL